MIIKTEKFYRVMAEKGMRRMDIAPKFISDITYNKILKGMDVRPATVKAVADALGTEVEKII